MAKSQPLKLSDLRPGVDYSVTGPQEQSERRCLFLVKLTDFSMRSIESLINSDKVGRPRGLLPILSLAPCGARCATSRKRRSALHLETVPFSIFTGCVFFSVVWRRRRGKWLCSYLKTSCIYHVTHTLFKAQQMS